MAVGNLTRKRKKHNRTKRNATYQYTELKECDHYEDVDATILHTNITNGLQSNILQTMMDGKNRLEERRGAVCEKNEFEHKIVTKTLESLFMLQYLNYH